MSLSRKKIKQMGAVALLVILMFIMGCFFIKDDKVKTSEKNDYGKTLEKNDYGVFLNADASSLERFKKYDLIVIESLHPVEFFLGIGNCCYVAFCSFDQ